MGEVGDILETCMLLDQRLADTDDSKNRVDVILEHISLAENKLKLKCPQFRADLEWMNVSRPLTLEQLRGKVVVLDFFTYCCINCLHVLPDLAALEEEFTIQDGVLVIGVHSAKFENEKISSNILSAILRYNIDHPVMNDNEATLWSELMIQCWPTFVVLSPNGNILQFYVGEGHRERMIEFVRTCVLFFNDKNMLSSHDIPLQLEKHKRDNTPLKFPGKVSFSDNIIVISDTGHNRVLVLSKEGIVQHCIGGKERGFKDGNFSECRFDSPQGIAVQENHIYVADTENHAIRMIDLQKQEVTTIAGTGKQGNDKAGGNFGTEQELSSPWDIVIGPSPDGQMESVLYIAVAGTHQIWAYFLLDVKWYHGKDYKQGSCVRFAGSGNEENRNNNYPEKAAFAQPSGLTLGHTEQGSFLFVADSESSTIRSVALKDGAVKHVAGGERDPMNLFAYGDKDGKGIDAKLQHPLGVAMVTSSNSLLVADSYNHKLKLVDIGSRQCTTLWGVDREVTLNEPGGVCVDSKKDVAYIADTNNHCIRILNIQDTVITQLPVIFQNDTVGSLTIRLADILKPGKEPEKYEVINVVPGSEVKVNLMLKLPDKSCVNNEAPSKWTAVIQDDAGSEIFSQTGPIVESSPQGLFSWRVPASSQSKVSIYLKAKVFYCDESKACRMKEKVYLQELNVDSVDAKSEVLFDFSC
ncbi:NHL repeat-containing protein 2-like isoform X1 [Crassostrea virginica]